jgi:hypothetical protein
MTEKDIERIVSLTLQRLRPPTLLLISEAQEYREIIHSRLSSCDCLFRLAFEKGEEETMWYSLGNVYEGEGWLHALSSVPHRAMVIPFMSYSLAADVINGLMHRSFAKAIHQALSCGLPVFALHYYCDPDSEINRLKGNGAHPGYVKHVQATLMALKQMGVTLCSLDELISNLLGSECPNALMPARRYITINDIINNKVKVDVPGLLLTDAASDYLKNQKTSNVN